jgi:hypothetical protein
LAEDGVVLSDSMASIRHTLTAVAILLGATCGLAATPSKEEALRAISVLERSATSPQAAAAAKTIVVYAQLSDDVMVDVGPEQLPWISEDWGIDKDREAALQTILVAAFVAGNVKPQIKNEKAADDTYSGWLFTIETYRRLRARDDFRSPSIDALSKMQSEGKLLDHAKEVHLDDQDDQADKQPRPLA